MSRRVLVVDDEEELRQAVIERVRWGEAGFEAPLAEPVAVRSAIVSCQISG